MRPPAPLGSALLLLLLLAARVQVGGLCPVFPPFSPPPPAPSPRRCAAEPRSPLGSFIFRCPAARAISSCSLTRCGMSTGSC